jgi:hypothetical protein
MPAHLLTQLECKNATCQTASLRKLHDGDGLYLWVYPDGRKYWRLRYWQGGKEKSLSLGVFDGKAGVTLKVARAKRDALRKKMESGLDPSAGFRKYMILRRLLDECDSHSVRQLFIPVVEIAHTGPQS